MGLELEGLTGAIIGAAIKVHQELGPGFLESVYENALVFELRHGGLTAEPQLDVPIVYRDKVEVGRHRLDLLVEKEIVVELKAISKLLDVHFAVVRSQLRAAGCRHGLLLNFAKVRLEVKRVIVS
jgi:GxxExxY protein